MQKYEYIFERQCLKYTFKMDGKRFGKVKYSIVGSYNL